MERVQFLYKISPLHPSFHPSLAITYGRSETIACWHNIFPDNTIVNLWDIQGNIILGHITHQAGKTTRKTHQAGKTTLETHQAGKIILKTHQAGKIILKIPLAGKIILKTHQAGKIILKILQVDNLMLTQLP